MGKTRPTFRRWFQHFRENDLKRYRRALRYQDQERFDQLLDDSEDYAMAAKAWNPPELREAVWLNLALAQQREIDELRERVEALEGD